MNTVQMRVSLWLAFFYSYLDYFLLKFQKYGAIPNFDVFGWVLQIMKSSFQFTPLFSYFEPSFDSFPNGKLNGMDSCL